MSPTEFYTPEKQIAEGKFGKVFLAENKETRLPAAIKEIDKRKLDSEEIEIQRREIEVLKVCQHPNIIRLLDLFEDPKAIYIVMEYMTGGDLYDYMSKRDFKISEDRVRSIFH